MVSRMIPSLMVSLIMCLWMISTSCGSEIPLWYSSYHSSEEVTNRLHYISSMYTSKSLPVSVRSIGTTYEGRNISALFIGRDAIPLSESIADSVVYLQAGLHAREWITIPALLYAIETLLKDAKIDNTLNINLSRILIIVVPLVNADGYEYSRTVDRLWAKNRSRRPFESCIGVNLNRNFAYKWNTIGSSNSPCSIIYHGSGPFSEPETCAVRDLLASIPVGSLRAMIDYHAYGQLILRPPGWTSSLSAASKATNEVEALAVSLAMASAMNIDGVTYESLIAGPEFYPVGGAFDDYAHYLVTKGRGLSYTIELRSKRSFVLPPSEIVPTGAETFQGLTVLLAHVTGGDDINYTSFPEPVVGQWGNQDGEILNPTGKLDMAATFTVRASSIAYSDTGPLLAIDDHPETVWMAQSDGPNEWLEFTSIENVPLTIRTARIYNAGERIKEARLEFSHGHGKWADIEVFTMGRMLSGLDIELAFPVTASIFRLVITSTHGGRAGAADVVFFTGVKPQPSDDALNAIVCRGLCDIRWSQWTGCTNHWRARGPFAINPPSTVLGKGAADASTAAICSKLPLNQCDLPLIQTEFCDSK